MYLQEVLLQMLVNVELSEAQQQFLTSQTKGTIMLAGIGTGKSYILVLKGILSALKGNTVLLLSYSLNNLRDNIVPLTHKICLSLGLTNKNYSITQSPAIDVKFSTGKILMRTGSNPDLLRGPSVQELLMDEGRELTKYCFDVAIGRLRGGDDIKWSLSTTTRGKDWVYNLLEPQGLTNIYNNEKFLKNDYITAIKTTVYDSPWCTKEYIKELEKQYTSSFQQQELMAMLVEGEGPVFNSAWFKRQSPNESIEKTVRYWDIAVSVSDKADFSAGALVSKLRNNKYYLRGMKQFKLQWPDLKRQIIQVALDDGIDTIIAVENAGQQLGLIDDLRRCPELHNYNIKAHKPIKDKVTRAYPLASQCELGNVYINKGGWVNEFNSQCNTFSLENIDKYHNDMIDAFVGAYSILGSEQTVQLAKW